MIPTDRDIKISAIQRLLKEREYYIKECIEFEEQLANGEDVEKLVVDSKKMAPLIEEKIKEFIQDIPEDILNDEEVKAVVEQAKKIIS